MRPSSTTLLVAARCFLEAALFATLAAALHQADGSARRVPLVALALVLLGASQALVAALGGRRSRREATRLAAGVALAGALGGVLLDPDARGLALLTRLVGFGLLAEAFLWRVLSIARDPARWQAARDGWLVACLALGLAALLPGPFDQAALVPLALGTVVAGGAALSLARAAEELRDERADPHADRTPVTVGIGTVVLAMGALLAALVEPAAQDALGPLVRTLGDLAARALVVALLPLALLAGWLTEVIRGFLGGRVPQVPQVDQSALDRARADEAANLQAIETLRPFVVGALELLVVLAALAFGLLLVERMVRERRAGLPAGTTLEREQVEGIGLGAMLGALRGARPRRRVAPPDDGSPAAAARILYWRFLALAERVGPGRRAPTDTPLDHVERIAAAEPRWSAALPVVAAFSAVRYAERAPAPAELDAARAALRGLEAAP
ncbi:MAG: DUF4129 domain-containing protein [Candidatus Limnocylindria bacterium]|nr:DUF4129 domain-containing protein [Candidatus Limnocylindria bacterium]